MDDVEAVVADMVMAVRSKLMGFPAAVTPLILGKEDRDEVARILTKYLHELLNDLQRIDPEAIRVRNRKMTKYQEKIAENNTTRVSQSKTNLTRVKI
jgi:hypothetical protein